jgi:hypothetical protein
MDTTFATTRGIFSVITPLKYNLCAGVQNSAVQNTEHKKTQKLMYIQLPIYMDL